MTKPSHLEAGTWWRFDSYRIRDGVIRPSPRAKLIEYDPWDAFRALRATPGQRAKQPRHRELNDEQSAKGRGERLPYQTLIDLVAELEGAPEKSERLVAAWCSRHGLLGLLLHQVYAVTFPPRWERFTGPLSSIRDTKSKRRVSYRAPVLHRYYRTVEGWRATRTENRAAALTGKVPKLSLMSVPPECIPDSWPKPAVLALSEPDMPHSLEHRSFDQTWARFFPGVGSAVPSPEAHPLPRTPRFSRAYGEPLVDFLNAARRLRDALSFLGASDERMGEGLRIVQALAAPANVALIPSGPGEFEQRWASPSLLATFAMMLTQHLAHPNARPLVCPVCTAPFVSANYQTRYCSKRCNGTQNQRNWRASEGGKAYAEEEKAERKRARSE